MRTDTGDRIFLELTAHRGRDNAIGAEDICRAIGWPIARERAARRIIAEESALWPEYVCASPGTGFYVAETLEEILDDYGWIDSLCTELVAKRHQKRELARRLGFNLPERVAA